MRRFEKREFPVPARPELLRGPRRVSQSERAYLDESTRRREDLLFARRKPEEGLHAPIDLTAWPDKERAGSFGSDLSRRWTTTQFPADYQGGHAGSFEGSFVGGYDDEAVFSNYEGSDYKGSDYD